MSLDIATAFNHAKWAPAIVVSLLNEGCSLYLYLVKIIHNFLEERFTAFNHAGKLYSRKAQLGCLNGGILSSFLWPVLIDDFLQVSVPVPVADEIFVVS